MIAEMQIDLHTVHKEDQYTSWKVFVSPSLLTVFPFAIAKRLRMTLL